MVEDVARLDEIVVTGLSTTCKTKKPCQFRGHHQRDTTEWCCTFPDI